MPDDLLMLSMLSSTRSLFESSCDCPDSKGSKASLVARVLPEEFLAVVGAAGGVAEEAGAVRRRLGGGRGRSSE